MSALNTSFTLSWCHRSSVRSQKVHNVCEEVQIPEEKKQEDTSMGIFYDYFE